MPKVLRTRRHSQRARCRRFAATTRSAILEVCLASFHAPIFSAREYQRSRSATSNPMNRVAAAPGYLQWYIVLFEFVLSVRALAYYLAQQSYTRIFQSDATYY